MVPPCLGIDVACSGVAIGEGRGAGTTITWGVGTAFSASDTSFCTSSAVMPGCIAAVESATALATRASISSLVAPGWTVAATASWTILLISSGVAVAGMAEAAAAMAAEIIPWISSADT